MYEAIGSVYIHGSISISWNGFSHTFIRDSASIAPSVMRAFLTPDFITDREDCIENIGNEIVVIKSHIRSIVICWFTLPSRRRSGRF